MVLQCEWAQVQVILLTNEGDGFGFGISGSRTSGPVVRNIFPGGAAEKDGSLQNGDHLLAIGEVRLWGMGAEQVAAILRQAGQESIRLVVARPVDPTVPSLMVNSVIVPTKVLSDPMELESTLQSSLMQHQVATEYPFMCMPSSSLSQTLIPAGSSSESEPISSSHQPMLQNVPLPIVPNGPSYSNPATTVTSSSGANMNNSVVTLSVTPPPPPPPPPPIASPTQSSSTATICEADVHCPDNPDGAAEDRSEWSDKQAVDLEAGPQGAETKNVIVRPSQASSGNIKVDVRDTVMTADECGGGKRSGSLRATQLMSAGEQSNKDSNQKLTRKSSVPSSVHLSRKEASQDQEGRNPVKGRSRPNGNSQKSKCGHSSTRQSSLKKMKSKESFQMVETALPEKEEYLVELAKGHTGLGITVAGYVCEKEDLCGIFVKSVIPKSIADLSGKIRVNDQIVEVDGVGLTGFTNQEAVDMLKKTGPKVKLKIVRYLRGLRFEELRDGISKAKIMSPTPATTSNTSDLNADTISYEEDKEKARTRRKSEGNAQKQRSKKSSSRENAQTKSAQNDTDDDGKEKSGSKSRQDHRTAESVRRTASTDCDRSSKDQVVAEERRSNSESTNLRHLVKHETAKTVKSMSPEDAQITAKWMDILGQNAQIVIAHLRKPEDSGLGISLEGTVDVEEGREVRPRHYIRSILPGGSVHRETSLKSGDELLEVNGKRLRDLFHEDVITSLKNLPQDVTLICCRWDNGTAPIRCTIVDKVDTSKSEKAFSSRNILSGSLQSLLLAAREPEELLVKAKSEVSLVQTNGSSSEQNRKDSDRTSTTNTDLPPLRNTKKASKSLEDLTCGPMWSSMVEEVVIVKGDKGLGFSILDYQDPQKMSETVIVVRSLIPGGVAQHDGRIKPGDRLVFVNSVRLDNASLDMAVQALKGAPFGPVTLGVARPLAEVQQQIASKSVSQQNTSTSSPLSRIYASSECNTQEQSNISDLKTDVVNEGDDTATPTQSLTSSTIDLDPRSDLRNQMYPMRGHLEPARNIPILPELPKFNIVVSKMSHESLGIQLEALSFDLCGTVVKEIDPRGAVGRDGRLRVGDLILFLNHETMWRATSSQAKIILRRAEFVSTGIPITFVPEEDLDISTSSPTTSSSSSSSSSSPASSNLNVKDSEAKEVCSPSNLSLSESLRLSEIREEESWIEDESSTEVIEPDLTVTSALAPLDESLIRFPSDLIESSVDPDLERQGQALNSRDSDTMVRVYNPPPNLATSHSSQTRKVQPVKCHSLSNGAKPNDLVSLSTGMKAWGEPRTVTIVREPGKGLGLSIVGGKVECDDASPGSASTINGIFVKNVLPDSPAGRTGQLFMGDRILEIDGIRLTSSDQSVAVRAIKNASDDAIHFVVQSLKTLQSSPTREEEDPDRSSSVPKVEPQRPADESVSKSGNLLAPRQQHAQTLSPNRDSPVSPTRSGASTPSSTDGSGLGCRSPPAEAEVVQAGLSDLERQVLQQKLVAEIIAKKEEHLTVYKKSSIDVEDDDGVEVDDMATRVVLRQGSKSHSCCNIDIEDEIKKSREEIEDKVVGSDDEDETDENDEEREDTINRLENFKALPGQLLEVDLLKDPKFGLGLALTGHSDRTRMGTFVCGINPQGPAALAEVKLMPGDEILKVHQAVVRGRSHLNVAAIIGKVPVEVPIKVVALRNNSNLDKLAVKEFRHFPAFLDDVIFGSDEFLKYLAKRDVKMHKTTEGLGLMIIEGSHKVLGKGIFISDIQQNSLAFRAELKVGDMILACNTESFLGVSHDMAASILRNVSGNVRLLVVNPADEIKRREESPPIIEEPVQDEPSEMITEQRGEQQDANCEEKVSQQKKLSIPDGIDGSEANSKRRRSSLAPPSGELAPGKSPSKSPAKSPGRSPGKSPARSIQAENTIDIKRDSTTPLGLEVVGGSDTAMVDVFVHDIVADGLAHKDGRIKVGDRILSVNGVGFDDGKISHDEALRVLNAKTQEKLSIVVDRRTLEENEDENSDANWMDFDIEIAKKAGKSLGLVLVPRKADGKGVFVSRVVPGSPAAQLNRMEAGDHIWSINDKDVSESKLEEVAALIKASNGGIKMTLKRRKKTNE